MERFYQFQVEEFWKEKRLENLDLMIRRDDQAKIEDLEITIKGLQINNIIDENLNVKEGGKKLC